MIVIAFFKSRNVCGSNSSLSISLKNCVPFAFEHPGLQWFHQREGDFYILIYQFRFKKNRKLLHVRLLLASLYGQMYYIMSVTSSQEDNQLFNGEPNIT